MLKFCRALPIFVKGKGPGMLLHVHHLESWGAPGRTGRNRRYLRESRTSCKALTCLAPMLCGLIIEFVKLAMKNMDGLKLSPRATSGHMDRCERSLMTLQAKDVMTKQVICIGRDTPIFEALKLMANHNVTGIPVVEDNMNLIGILSEQDVLRLFHTMDDEKDRTVNDFMTQPVVHFAENERLLDICYCLRDNSIRRVPVTSNGKVVGVISRSDIIRCILQQAEQRPAQTARESA